MYAHVTNLLGSGRARPGLIGFAVASRVRLRCIEGLSGADAEAAAMLSCGSRCRHRSGKQIANRT